MPAGATQALRTVLKDALPDQFLDDCWQKRPCYVPRAVDTEALTLTPDEIAWLAAQPDVESRLVRASRTGGRTRYRLEQGPFTAAQLGALPASDWTLLVQDVDKHLPELRRWFDHVDFIPQWRIDDLMVSVAAPGGSVGPHLDHYDVFLCQGVGERQWRLGDPAAVVADDSAGELELLRPFTPVAEYPCRTGDVLYLPPGIPHWGTATDLSVTWSLGMRAPTMAEFCAAAAGLFGQPQPDAPAPDETRFYADPDLAADEADDGRISVSTLSRCRRQGLVGKGLCDLDLAQVVGTVVTATKAWLTPESPDERAADALLNGSGNLEVHGMALLAWCRVGECLLLFANGAGRDVPTRSEPLLRALCRDRMWSRATIDLLRRDDDLSAVLDWLLARGVFDQAEVIE